MNFKIISDTSCDLPREVIEKHDIGLVPFYITFDGGASYVKEGVELSVDELYQKMAVKGMFPKTSLPSMMDYADAFKPYLEEGRDILCICLSSEFSGSYQSAFNASQMLMDEFPDRKIKVLDSRLATLLQGLLVNDAAEYRDEGKSLDETYDLLESYKDLSRAFITVDTLEYLQKGGRVGKAQALAGGILNIKPIIVLEGGALSPHSKARGRKKAIAEVVDISYEYIKGKEDQYRVWLLGNGIGFDEDIALLAELAKEKGLKTLGLGKIGSTITVHAGPGLIGLAIVPNKA